MAASIPGNFPQEAQLLLAGGAAERPKFPSQADIALLGPQQQQDRLPKVRIQHIPLGEQPGTAVNLP